MSNAPLEPELHSLLMQAYRAARRIAGPDANLVVLHIGAEQTLVAVGDRANCQAIHELPIGSERTAREHFLTKPPTPLAMENAIVTVEDAVMPLRPSLPRDARLFTQDDALREIAILSGVLGSSYLSLEAMERNFDNLTAVVMGMPAEQVGLPPSNAFAAMLLILREFMHHMQFAQLEVLAK